MEPMCGASSCRNGRVSTIIISVAHLSGGLIGLFFGTRGSEMCDAGVTPDTPAST